MKMRHPNQVSSPMRRSVKRKNFQRMLSSISGIALILVALTFSHTPVRAQDSARGYEVVTPDDASVPPAPRLFAIPGDGQVTLYWDDFAESFQDPALAGSNRSARNFEGYKVYKSTDPEFLDALRVTDNQGNRQGYRAIAQYDLVNDISEYHPASINGVRYWLGTDNGLRRIFVDTDVINGRTYYYAVVAYTHGDALPDFVTPLVNPQTGQIYDPPLFPNQVYVHSPRESALDIAVNQSTGAVTLGRNVAEVIPTAPVFGYQPPEDPQVTRVSGTGAGTVDISIIDPSFLQLDNTYSITFRDTIISGTDLDRVVTQDFTLTNTTSGQVVYDRQPLVQDRPLPFRDGLSVLVTNPTDTVRNNPAESRWVSEENNVLHNYEFAVNTRFARPSDYRVEFDDGVVSTSLPFNLQVGNLTLPLPAEDVNFKVFNTSTGQEIPFAFFANPNIPRDLRDVFFLDNDLGWTVGGAGQLRKTEDGGQVWRAINTGVDARLFEVQFIDDQTGWAAGSAGTIIKTVNGGDDWTVLNTQTEAELTSLYFKDASDGFAVGADGLIIRTTDGGETWSVVASGTTRSLRSITFATQDIGYVVGDRAVILRTADGGDSWTQIPTSEFVGGTTGDRLRNINQVFFLDATLGWAVGFSGVIWATTDGGTTWSRQATPSNTQINRVVFTDASNGYAVGPNGYHIVTTNGGATWTTGDMGISQTVYGITALDSDKIFAVGQGPTILTTEDAGANWSLTTTEKRFRAFIDETGQGRSDEIYFVENFGANENIITWKVSMQVNRTLGTVDPGAGDALQLSTIKPFTASDAFTFSITEQNIPQASAQEVTEDVLSEIRVVPNPYVVTHLAERSLGASTNELHFINLPTQATIRIFNVSGQLVQTLSISNDIAQNRYIWNMRNRHGETIPYGVYIYHVEAPGVGEHTGKFAVIK